MPRPTKNTLTDRARRLLKAAAEEELALYVAWYERVDADLAAGKVGLNSSGYDNDARMKNLLRLLGTIARAEQQESTHGR